MTERPVSLASVRRPVLGWENNRAMTKTSTLAAGSIALADKEFLGWRRLNFENGQTGWVRKDDIVPLWK